MKKGWPFFTRRNNKTNKPEALRMKMNTITGILIFLILSSCSLLSGGERPDIPGKIVFSAKDNADTYQIFTMNADGSDVDQLTTHERFSVEPAWSPDGSRIAFATFREAPQGATTLWVMQADGSNQRPLVTHPQTGRPMFGGNPAWSPDGTKLAFDYCVNCELGGLNREIFIADLQTGRIDTLVQHPASDSHPAWSPDGNQIIFASRRDRIKNNDSDLYSIDIDSENIERLTNTGNAGRPVWHPKGEKIFFWSNNSLFELSLSTKETQHLTINPGNTKGFRPLTISPKGNYILLHVFDYAEPNKQQSFQRLNLSDHKMVRIYSGNRLSSADWRKDIHD